MKDNKFYTFVDIVKTLRSPGGCEWDRQHNLFSLKNDFIEEAYEVIDALDNKDISNLKEELGDVLLHIVLHSQIANEEALFTIDDVIAGISEKIIRRHPHVFGDIQQKDPEKIMAMWEEIKKEERKGVAPARTLDKANKALPTVPRAIKLQKAAAKVGFDWDNSTDVLNKVDEELGELKVAILDNNKNDISEELGDLLFSIINLSRHLNIDADEALRDANKKFVTRFNYVEDNVIKQDKTLNNATLDEMENLWNEAKICEKKIQTK